MKTSLLPLLVAISISASAKVKDSGRPLCATVYTVVQQDKLGNIQQGLSNPKNVKWADKDLEKKYPDVCYAAPDQSVKTVFVIIVTPATSHGTRVETNTETTPTSGTVTDASTGETATYEGTQTSTSSTAVPYSFEYGKFMLAVETFGADGKPVVRHRFQQSGIYRTMYAVPLGGRGHHPVKALIEDAVKWIHAGGLEDPLQSVQGAVSAAANAPSSPAENDLEVRSVPNTSATLRLDAASPQASKDASIGVFCEGNPDVRHDGVALTALTPGGPADQAGIKAGDVILAINDHYLFTIRELQEEISHHEPGTKIVVRYRRYTSINEVTVVVGRVQ